MDIRENTIDFKKEIAKKYNVGIHELDYAIKLACQNYSTALSSIKSGVIKHFRVRYWNNQRKVKIMDFEKYNFKSGSIRRNVLGDVIGYYNGKLFDFKTVKCNCRLQYKTVDNAYYLYVPQPITPQTETTKKDKFISLDPGIRTFMTGITEDRIVEIGKKIKDKITGYLRRLDRVKNNDNIRDKKKKKNEKLCYKKIANQVNELHWKSINYLTRNYETVLIGNMSSKGIVSNASSNLNDMIKRVAMHLRFYEFRERLKYKCFVSNTGYKLIDERYTSKMCSNCGKINTELGASKVFSCNKCNIVMDRDVNGSRGILLKGIK